MMCPINDPGNTYEGHLQYQLVSAFPLTGALEQTVRKPVNHEENVCADHLTGGNAEDRAEQEDTHKTHKF